MMDLFPFSINLREINFPNQYLIVFINELNYVKNGLLCELIQKTNEASSPPIRFSILPSLNSSTIGPGQTKTIEVKVVSLSHVPLTVNLSTVSNLPYMNSSFDPHLLKIAPTGRATSQLTIKSNWEGLWKPSITQTLPIIAKVGISENRSFAFNTYFFNVSSPQLPKPTELGIAITLFNFYDWILNTLNIIGSALLT
jgi:hypothetical protein